jgi:hypothetical protein
MSNGDTTEPGGAAGSGTRLDKDYDKLKAAAGQFTEANLPELATFVSKWSGESDSIVADGQSFPKVSTGGFFYGGTDDVTMGYLGSLSTAVDQLVQHNQSMAKYSNGYLDNMKACLRDIHENEHVGARRFHNRPN